MAEDKDKLEIMQKAEMFAQTKDLDKALMLPFDDTNEVPQDLIQKFDEQATLDDKEQKRVNKRIKGIWKNYRNNVLSKIDLENYKKFCELEQIRAESDKKLDVIKFERDKARATQWLEMHKGNLEEIGYNTTSLPNKFWYGLNRGIWYLRKTFSNVPKLTWYILAGISGLAVIVLMVIGIGKLV